jgi:NAD(P)-dependent dehydrogenase (short-subunit alcohol dehydrogenase family)
MGGHVSQGQQKVAVVTGGTSGIGFAAARRFVQEGLRVFVTGRRKAELDTAVAELGKNATGVQGDVSNLADLDRLYATVKREAGHIDVLFANAGLGEFLPLEAITEEHFDRTFGANVKGVVFTVQKALPLLRDGSSIILNGSIVSITGTAALSVYSATKAAVRSFARSWMLELKDRRIRINVLSPGPIDTPGLSGLAPNAEQAAGLKARLVEGVPLGRLGTPEEMANVAWFLASEQSSFVNGAEFFADGGAAQY